MSKKTHNSWLPVLFIVLLLASSSCEQDKELENRGVTLEENFVDFTLANEIANGISFTAKSQSLKKESTQISSREVESIQEVINNEGITSFYVINYKEGGYVILSADKRTQPILGFSENGKFVIDENAYPPALSSWIKDTKNQITAIQSSGKQQSSNEELAWKLVRETLANPDFLLKNKPIDECYDHTEIITFGPLLNTTWYQTGGFNDELSYIDCDGNSFQVYAGCVPIAMAQIMKYHQYPTHYNWTAMPPSFASTTTADFIEDIHTAIGAVYNDEPSYDCDGTGVSSSADMSLVFRTEFNYSSASKTNYDRHVVKSNIRIDKPVILSGDNGEIGHMWVCDGYRETNYYRDDCTGVGYLHLHMNWGWSNGAYNGWYGYNNFDPANTHFNNNRKMIYNITP